MEPPKDLQICHCDLWADNVRTTPTGGVCVIDWENCGPADPSQELCMVLFEFALGDPDRARSCTRRTSTLMVPRIDHPGNFSTAIAQYRLTSRRRITRDGSTRRVPEIERERCA